MTAVLENIKNGYNHLFYELADERSRDMFPSPMFVFTFIPFYIYFSISLGPRLMRDIKPFKLKNTMMVYNIIQIILCTYVTIQGLRGGWFGSYNFRCQPVDMADTPQNRIMLNAVWLYTMIKFTDLLDTVFFVLRKKDRQISFLHVFHHAIMPTASFLGLRFFPNGHGTFVGLINSIIHIFMYTYYLIAGLGPKYQKYLWWKKHLTTLQIVQFSIAFLHNAIALCDSSCEYPRWINWLLCFQAIHFTYMFSNFYYATYIKPQKQLEKNISKKKH